MNRSGRSRTPAASTTEQVVAAVAKSAARSLGTTVGRQIVRGLLGSLFRGR
jgi:hypothetical protein